MPYIRRLLLPGHSCKIGFVPCWFCGEYTEKHLGSSSLSSLIGLLLGFKGYLADSVPEEKIDKLLVSIDYALSQSSLPARQLASVTGSIISNLFVFGNVCKLMTKSLHRALDRREGRGVSS